MPADQIHKMFGRAARLAAAFNGSPRDRIKLVQGLIEKVIVDDKRIIIKMRPSALLGRYVLSPGSEDRSGSAIELTAAVAFKRRGVETKLILPSLDQPNYSAQRDPALIKAIARGRGWFDELATGRARRFRGFVRVGVDHRPTGHPGSCRWAARTASSRS